MAGALLLIVWLAHKLPRWLSRRAELEDRNPPTKIEHQRYQFDEQGRIVDEKRSHDHT